MLYCKTGAVMNLWFWYEGSTGKKEISQFFMNLQRNNAEREVRPFVYRIRKNPVDFRHRNCPWINWRLCPEYEIHKDPSLMSAARFPQFFGKSASLLHKIIIGVPFKIKPFFS